MKLNRTAAAVIILLMSGCGKLYFHDPGKARAKASMFLNYLYVKGDIVKAYELAGDGLIKDKGAPFLYVIAGKFKEKYGVLDGVRADYYVIEPGKKQIMVFYRGISEKGISYHRVILNGDGKIGYSVINTSFAGVPYKKYRTAVKYK